MRIEDRSSLGPPAAEAGRTPEVQKTDHANAGRSGAAGSGEGDRVELSSTWGRLAQAIATHETRRADQVRAVAADYQNGRFRANSVAVSRGLVAEALTGRE